MKRILVLNGPNLNLLGVREKSIYGDQHFESYLDQLRGQWPEVAIDYYQSNVEGEIIDRLHQVGFEVQGIILNAGGYTHTSVAISDAIAAIQTPVIEVHISNIHARESYRHESLISKNCIGIIAGFGLDSYHLAVTHFVNNQGS